MDTLRIKVGVDEAGKAPLCPYCDKSLDEIKDNRSHFMLLSNLHVFSCPRCNKVLNAIVASK